MSRRYEGDEDEEEFLRPILPTVPEKCGTPTITLGLLMDFAVQQTYHELTVLAELLPKKLDADRKISIIQFAHSTRTLFIKLLAVVKWIKSSKKFDSCSSICYFLDQQAQYFIDTADYLVTLAREELVHARLPAFQVPAAIDVLTLGDFPRLPVCITSQFVTDRSITKREETSVLYRLNQVLKTKLSQASPSLSHRIREISFKNGMVNLVVPGEFEVSLTLLGQKPTTKWTLLNIRFLVEDYEIGFGTQLIHPLQVNSVHNLLQLRMDQSEEPLKEVYNILHSVAQSLQLDILFCQATQVISGHMRKYAIIESYNRKEGVLIIAYWLRWTQQKRYVSQYRIKIFIDLSDPHTGLKIRHYPPNKKLPSIDDRSGRLSLNKILSQTMSIRCHEKLLRIRKGLENIKPLTRVLLTGNATFTLTYPLLDKRSHISEKLVVSVNNFSGRIEAVVAALDDCKEVKELALLFNEDSSLEKISAVIQRLRILVMMERFRKAVASLPVRIVDESFVYAQFSSLKIISPDRLCFQFIKEDIYFLVVSFKAKSKGNVDLEIYLFSAVDGRTNRLQLHPSQMLETWTSANFRSDSGDPAAKRQRWLGSTKQLTSAISAIDDRLAFMRLCDELDKRKVKYLPLETERVVGGLILRITDFSEAITSGSKDFFELLVNCCLRLDTRARVIWPFEYTLSENPLTPDYYEGNERASSKAERTKTTVLEIYANAGFSQHSTSESVYCTMLERLIVYSHVYDVAKHFAKAYYSHFYKFCNISAFTYYKLVIAYGEFRNNLMLLTWKVQKIPKPAQYFHLTFGMYSFRDVANAKNLALPPKELLWNPHTILQSRLQDMFNRRRSLIDLMQYLIDTVEPLSCLCNFAHTRIQSLRTYAQIMSYETALPISLQTDLVVINETTLRLIYGPVTLEFLLLGDSKVGVRDASRKTPAAAHLRSFCNKFANQELMAAIHDGHSPGPGWLRSPSAQNTLSHHMGRSPAMRLTSSPISHVPLSVSASDLEMSPMRSSETAPFSRVPFLIDHAALRRMTAVDSSGFCPLHEYLFALSYLARLGPALENYQIEHRNNAHSAIQFGYLRHTVDSVQFSVPCAVPSKRDFLTLNIYLDEKTMSLKLELKYEGDEVPSRNDIEIAERYFERCVAPLSNELAVIAFANACRLTTMGTFSSMTQIMEAQMMWREDSNWKPSLQLVTSGIDSTTQRMRVTPGVIIDPSNVNVLILLCLRPSRPEYVERGVDPSKHLIQLIYNTQTNTVGRRNLAEDDSNNTASILSSISEQYARTSERSLWPAVRTLAYKYLQS